MASGTDSHQPFTLGNLLTALCQLVYRNGPFWIFIIVSMHIASWKFIFEVLELFNDFIKHTAGYDINIYVLVSDYSRTSAIICFVLCKSFTDFITIYIIYKKLKLNDLYTPIRLRKMIDIFGESDFIIGVTKTFIIMIINQLCLIVLSFVADRRSDDLPMPYIIVGSCIAIMYYLLMIRIWFAIPIAVIKRKSIWESIVRSWRVTRPLHVWFSLTYKILLVTLLLLIIYVLTMLCFRGANVFDYLNVLSLNCKCIGGSEFWVRTLASLMFLFGAVVYGILTSLLYFDLRSNTGDLVE